MGYMHINNLYKDQKILAFKECYAMEKIDGTSAHLKFMLDENTDKCNLTYFSGGAKHENFISIFNHDELYQKFVALGHYNIIVFGEAYGGKMQGMSHTYGKELRFVAFDVKVGETWLNVENANGVCEKLGLDFVSYNKISTSLKDIDAERDAPSIQAVKNGIIDEPKIREGVVLRPIEEFRDNQGARIICKHKRDEFRETTKKRKVVDKEKLKVLANANEIANEWVTDMRLQHVLQKFPEDVNMDQMGSIIKAMYEDVIREAAGEIVENKFLGKTIAKKTAVLFKQMIQRKLNEKHKT